MKTSRANVESNRERLLATASEQVRKHGIDGVKVADLMREVGLTHGGFTTYFTSKEDLVAQACAATVQRQAERLQRIAETGDAATERAGFFERYLSRKNRDQPDQACLFPALASEMQRQPPSVREIYTDGLKSYVAGLRVLLGGNEAEAMAVMSSLVGAMVLARAVDDPDFSDRILEAVRDDLTRDHVVEVSAPG